VTAWNRDSIPCSLNQAGFTLLEVLWALLVAAIVAGSLAASLRLAHEAKKKAEANALDARTAHATLDILCRDLEAALPPTGVLVGPFIGNDPAAPSASGEILQLYVCRSGTALYGPNSDGIQRIAYGVGTVRDDTTGESVQSLLRSVTHNLLAPAAVAGAPEVVCRGLKSFSIQYFDGLLWHEMWDSTAVEDQLPCAVQVTIDVTTRPLASSMDPLLSTTVPPYRATRTVSIPCAVPRSAAASGGLSLGGSQ